MEFEYRYLGHSAVTHAPGAGATGVQLAPDLRRPPTFFRGELAQPLAFREAISALHDVVVSDHRFQPKDRTEYEEWAKQRDAYDLEAAAAGTQQLQDQIARVRSELDELHRRRAARMAPFYRARRRYFNYLYRQDRDMWIVLDPVITIHPDEVSFECFSQDESSYGRLAVNYDHFANVGEHACGTTNVDYSAALYDAFQKIRTYKTTTLEVDPTGFDVATTNEAMHREVKIDLPDSWVRGFLQVSSAMTFPAVHLRLHPYDVHNLCFVLRRHKELRGPRSLRFELEPGRPVRVRVDPWDTVVECPRSSHEAPERMEVRLWGRRRLHVLERCIPRTRWFDVRLLGTGMPSFWIADMGAATFTLGLSGWTKNDWSHSGNFDLLAPRRDVDAGTAARVFEALRADWRATAWDLADRLELDRAVVHGALASYTQAGRVIYDPINECYRARELSRDPLPVDALRFRNERESAALQLVESGKAAVEGIDHGGHYRQLRGTVGEREVVLVIDADDRLVMGRCTCWFHFQNQLRKGPCRDLLALRLLWERTSRKEVPAAKP